MLPTEFDWTDESAVDALSPTQIEPILMSHLGPAMTFGPLTPRGRTEFAYATMIMVALNESFQRRHD